MPVSGPTAATPTRTSPPRYFHLLWDEDLDELREVLIAVRDRRAEVVSAWYRLYELHFGDCRTLLENQFREIFEPSLLHNQDALLGKDMDAYARGVFMLGEQLADRGVSMQEVIASLHLFEEAAQSVFPTDPHPPPTSIPSSTNSATCASSCWSMRTHGYNCPRPWCESMASKRRQVDCRCRSVRGFTDWSERLRGCATCTNASKRSGGRGRWR